MNDSPVGCQSRLTEAASSRKKEPYRPHQAKPELVARLEVTSKGVIFFIGQHPFLHTLKQIGIDNGRNSFWNNGVGVFIFANVFSVLENEIQTGNTESRVFSGAKSALVQRIGNDFKRFAPFIARKDFGKAFSLQYRNPLGRRVFFAYLLQNERKHDIT